MATTPNVRRLGPADADALVALRREALVAAPLAFASSAADDRMTPEFARTALADTEEQAVFGHFMTTDRGEKLAGMVGIVRMARAKQRHNASIWGMYVTPAARGIGAGAALLAAAVETARGWPGVEQVHLGVTTAAPAARRLYERAGFQQWGTEPRALAVAGVYVDEAYMVLTLSPAPRSLP